MNELQTFLRNYVGGMEALDAWLRSQPQFRVFCSLLPSYLQIPALCEHFELQTVAQAQEFADSLLLGPGWVAYRDKLASWINPRPPVALMHGRPAAVIQQAIAAQMNGYGDPVFIIEPQDPYLFPPTFDEARAIMEACPSKRIPWIPNVADCDDHVRVLRGWLSACGVGALAIGDGKYRAYGAPTKDEPEGEFLGGHNVALIYTRDVGVVVGEPRDGTIWHLEDCKKLGGLAGLPVERIGFYAEVL